MKLNKFIFKHFAPIPSKQWKQKIQYELNGANYQTELVNTNIDGISTLPFYTNSENIDLVDFNFSINTHKAVTINVTNSIKDNLKALEAINEGANSIYFNIFSKEINLSELLINIKFPLFINCHFLNVSFTKEIKKIYQGNSLTILTDPIGKLLSTGNWYRNSIWDFEQLQQIISINNDTLSINMCLYNNAGASQVQQLSYGISQVLAYSKHLLINTCKSITYQVSVGTNIFIEVAKLKTLRILHNSLNKELNTQLACTIILHKNKRNLQAINTSLNIDLTKTEQLIGYAAGVDIITSVPEDFFFLKEENNNPYNIELNSFLKTDLSSQAKLFKENIYVEKLVHQLLNKCTELIYNIELGSGLIVQFKKGILLQKIEQKAIAEQIEYKKQFEKFITNKSLINKKPTSYPFFTFKNKKTRYKPILERRLAAPLEKPIWDSIFKHD